MINNYEKSGTLTDEAREFLSKKCFYGVDVRDENISRTRLNMFLVGDGHTHMYSDNSLKPTRQQGKSTLSKKYQYVITNPPYFNGTPAHHNAHHNTDIKKRVQHCCARVKPNGYICIIADTLCVDKIISVMDKKHFGNIQIFPLFGAKNSAERALIRAKQGARTGTTIFKGSSMNNDLILRDGLTIDTLLSTLSAL